MNKALLIMSKKEVNRLEIITLVSQRKLDQQSAAEQLGVCKRHIKRLLAGYKKSGAQSLISQKRGKPSNHRYPMEFKDNVLSLVQAHYSDFGPTLAAEKLRESYRIVLSKETLRQWMKSEGLWKGKNRRYASVHQQRDRRECYGELVQIDGSPHDWFEGRAPVCCLLVFIDDATSRLMTLRFVEAECTQGYFEATRDYLESHGRPLAFYSDKHGIFRINIAESKSGTGESQYGRALRELGIGLICANSPQAKGRVERANKTLQDRLVKELRLRKMNSIEEANAFLPIFIEHYNSRFAIEPTKAMNLHRQDIPEKKVLDLIFTKQYDRRLSKNLELSYNNIIYQVKVDKPSYHLRKALVKVCESEEGKVTLMYKNEILEYITFNKNNRPLEIVSKKEIDKRVRFYRHLCKPAKDHPWRNYERPSRTQRAA